MMWFYGFEEIKSQKIELNEEMIPTDYKEIYTDFLKLGFKFKTYLIDFLGFNTIFILAYNEEQLYIGSACGEFIEALVGALEEILITSFFAKTLKQLVPKNADDIKNLPQHFLYYQTNKKYELFKYLDNLSNDNFEINKSGFNYLEAARHLEKNGYKVYYKDLTAPELVGTFFVIKVIVTGFLDVIKNNALAWKGYYKIKKQIPEIPTPFA